MIIIKSSSLLLILYGTIMQNESSAHGLVGKKNTQNEFEWYTHRSVKFASANFNFKSS